MPGAAYLAILGWEVCRKLWRVHITSHEHVPQSLARLSTVEDTLGSKTPCRLKGVVGNEVVFSVPRARPLGLGLLSLANVYTLTSGPSHRGGAALRDNTRNTTFVG